MFQPVPVERLIHKFRQARDWKYVVGHMDAQSLFAKVLTAHAAPG